MVWTSSITMPEWVQTPRELKIWFLKITVSDGLLAFFFAPQSQQHILIKLKLRHGTSVCTNLGVRCR